MDLNYTDPERNDVGVLGKKTNIDIEIGSILSNDSNRNDFEITMPADMWDKRLDEGSIIYEDAADSEIGGVVLGKTSNTATNKIVIWGKTWRGLLNKEVVCPPSGQGYYQARNDANSFLADVLPDSFDGLISCTESECGTTVYRDIRYIPLLQAIEKTLDDKNLRLCIRFDRGKKTAVLSAEPVVIFDQIEYSQDYGYNLVAKDKKDGYNHCICLGKGELADRTVVHLYKLSDGTITTDEDEAIIDGNVGLNRRTIIYDNSNAEDEEALIEGGTDRLRSKCDTKTLEISNVTNVEIGDIVGARDRITGIHMQKRITSKIIKGYVDRAKIEYKVGE